MSSFKTKRIVAGLAVAAGLGVGGTAIAHADTTTTTATTAAPPTTTTATTAASATTATTAAGGTDTTTAPAPSRTAPPAGPGRHVDGTVDSIGPTSIVVHLRDGSTKTIAIDASTVLRVDKDTTAKISDFAAGQSVHIDLVDPSATNLVAATIEKAPAPPAGPGHGPGAHVDGVLDSISATSADVHLPDGTTKTIALTSSTAIRFDKDTPATIDDVVAGQRVHIDVVDANATNLVAVSIEVKLPHLDGTVTDVTGNTVTITDHDGFRRVIHTDGATTYRTKGADATSSAIVTGTDIHATGKIDANATDLDARSIVTR